MFILNNYIHKWANLVVFIYKVNIEIVLLQQLLLHKLKVSTDTSLGEHH